MQRRGAMLRANLCWSAALAGAAGAIAAFGLSLPGIGAAIVCVGAAWLGCLWLERAADAEFARRLQELGRAVGVADTAGPSFEAIVASLCGRLERATQFKAAFASLTHPAALVSPEGRMLGASAGLLEIEPRALEGEPVAALFGDDGRDAAGYVCRKHAAGGDRALLELRPAGAFIATDDLEAFAAALASGETDFRFDAAATTGSAGLRTLERGLESIDRSTRTLAQMLAGGEPDPDLLRSDSRSGLHLQRLAETLAGLRAARDSEAAARELLERKMQAVLTAIDRYRSAITGMAELADDGRLGLAMTAGAIDRGVQKTGAARAIGRKAMALAEDAAGAARRARSAAEEVSGTTAEVDRLVAAIEDVSFRTNLLALNAAVEAARAGDKGAGFAVVADEVRTLAQASQKTAREIRALVGTSRSQSGLGAEAAGELTNILAGLGSHLEILSNETDMIAGALDEGRGAISRLDGTVAALGEETTRALLLPRRKIA